MTVKETTNPKPASPSGDPDTAGRPKRDPRDTPAMRQYFGFKRQHPDCMLFFRMGDFYEMFFEDAIAMHKALGVTLTQRTEGVPMAGVPHHAAEGYIRRLIAQGFRVAVCDQIQDPKDAKGVVERAVTRVLTPGTLVDESLLADDASNCLAAISFLDAGDEPECRVAIALIEASTGAFTIIDSSARAAPDELIRRNVTEIIHAESADGQTPARATRLLEAARIPGTPRPAWEFRLAEGAAALHAHFRVGSLAGFGLAEDDPALSAAGAVLRYLLETQSPGVTIDGSGQERPASDANSDRRQPTLAHLQPPRREPVGHHLMIDATTLRALEVERTIRASDADGALLGVFSGRGACKTPMGRRLVRDWLCRPLAQLDRIEARHGCAATLTQDARTLSHLESALSHVQDVARIAGRIGVGRAAPRDLVALGGSLAQNRELAKAISNALAFSDQQSQLQSLHAVTEELAHIINKTCVENPPAHLREGGLIRDGVDRALDEARALRSDAGKWLAEYQASLTAEHNLPNLKVGFNRVFGYYIELPRAQADRAPSAFTRKQTLKNAERYITPELKEFEQKVQSAEGRAIEREQRLFADLCAKAADHISTISAFAQVAGELDALACFARVASARGWVKPEMTSAPELEIREGRHPVLEDTLSGDFVPNDVELGTAESPARLALITGPNMAGKSTYIRQTALIALLAHAGSFVPAKSARVGMIDRIFTRVGAEDALHAGQSTFMVEMTETANILRHATGASLVILDEVGRGTSTLDGLSLAWAVAEELATVRAAAAHQPSCPRVLFATHYHELTSLEEQLPGSVANLHVAVREWNDEIVFLHRIAPGRTDQSYGVHVARLAGLPDRVIARAREVLSSLAVSHEGDIGVGVAATGVAPSTPPASAQLSLFREYIEHPVVERLRAVELEKLTALEAFDLLRALTEEAEHPAE